MSEPKSKMKLFEEKQVRATWDEESEKWRFSVVDVIAVLTEQSDYSAVKLKTVTKTSFENPDMKEVNPAGK